jgi:hypothetical protein
MVIGVNYPMSAQKSWNERQVVVEKICCPAKPNSSPPTTARILTAFVGRSKSQAHPNK